LKLALVSIPAETPISEWPYPSLGLGYLASYVERHLDVDVVIIDGARGEHIIEEVERDKPDVIGITSTTLEFCEAERIGMAIKSQYEAPIIIGGVHVSALPHTLPECFDVGVIGEGEQTLVELLKVYSELEDFPENELKKISGICFHREHEVVLTKSRDLIEPLDAIPYPARDLLKMEKFYLKPQLHFPGALGRGTSMITSRGCPYRCVFCHSSRFWKTVRFHSPIYVVREIKHLINRYRVKCINIFDDIFSLSKKRLEKIVQLVKEEGINEEVKFGIQTRADLINVEMCKLLKEMGVIYLGFGLESGSEKILHYLKNAMITVEDNRKAVKIAKQFDFHIGSGFMIGNPNETIEDLELTRKFILENPLDVANVYITAPLPGSELWTYAKERGLVTDFMKWERINQFFNDENVILNENIPRDQFTNAYLRIKRACKSNRRDLRNLLLAILKNPSNILEILCHPQGLLKRTTRKI